MDRELAIKRLNKMRRVCDMEECNINCELCEEALDLAIEALKESADKYTNVTTNLYDVQLAKDLLGISEEAEKLQLSGETSTIPEKESVEDDLFNKSFWRMGMHDSNVRPRTMADTSTNEGDAESATTTDSISRQQAIEALTGWETEPLDEDIVRTLNNLPPVTLTVSEDCISREYMLKLQRELHGWMSNDKSHELWQKIKDAPSVTPTERTGEWINTGVLTVHCSNCESEFHELEAMNFCPNCGARMKGGDDE